MMDTIYSTCERNTSKYFEKLFRDPTFLKFMGNSMDQMFKAKILNDDFFLSLWKQMLLPNKRDQERTLHQLNEIESQLFDLEEKLEDEGERQMTEILANKAAIKDLDTRMERLEALSLSILEEFRSQKTISKSKAKSTPKKKAAK